MDWENGPEPQWALPTGLVLARCDALAMIDEFDGFDDLGDARVLSLPIGLYEDAVEL